MLWLIWSSWHFLSECLVWLWSSSGTGMRGNQLSLTPTARGTTGAMEWENSWLEINTGTSLTNCSHGWNKLYLEKIMVHSQMNRQRQSSQPTTATALPWPISRTGTQKLKSFFHTNKPWHKSVKIVLTLTGFHGFYCTCHTREAEQFMGVQRRSSHPLHLHLITSCASLTLKKPTELCTAIAQLTVNLL